MLALVLGSAPALAQEAASAIYVRSDSDQTTVVTPRLRVAAPLGHGTELGVGYMVDVWTSASIDIRTSASKAVTEQRDEINVNLANETGDWRFDGSYRYSTEPDYESHGVTLGTEVDLADRNTTFGLGLTGTFDQVGRVGDPGFNKDAQFISGRASYTQILTRRALVQAIYEMRYAGGYLASPYRFVGVGSPDGTCLDPSVAGCYPEAVPDKRLGHAIAARTQYAVGEAASVGGSYRLVFDDWNMLSHTVTAQVAWAPLADTTLSLRYRFYTQSAAYFYEPKYTSLPDSGLVSRDKKMSSLHTQRIAVDLDQDWELGEGGELLNMVLSLGPTFYKYRDFPLLDSVTAFEVTLAVGVQL